MDKLTTVEANIEPQLKQNVEQILADLGISVNQAIALFYEQVEIHHGLPFSIGDYNEETIATFDATDRGEDLVKCDDADDMFSKLGI